MDLISTIIAIGHIAESFRVISLKMKSTGELKVKLKKKRFSENFVARGKKIQFFFRFLYYSFQMLLKYIHFIRAIFNRKKVVDNYIDLCIIDMKNNYGSQRVKKCTTLVVMLSDIPMAV